MNLTQFQEQLPDYAKDIKLNLSTVLSEEGSPELTNKQIYAIALAATLAARNQQFVAVLMPQVSNYLTDTEINGVKSAVAIMAMNNIYYRFTHVVHDQEYAMLPPKLRMNSMANPGMDKIDFELASLAVSAINGCGKCMDAHTMALTKAGKPKLAVQSAIRIAAVIHAAVMCLEMMNDR